MSRRYQTGSRVGSLWCVCEVGICVRVPTAAWRGLQSAVRSRAASSGRQTIHSARDLRARGLAPNPSCWLAVTVSSRGPRRQPAHVDRRRTRENRWRRGAVPWLRAANPRGSHRWSSGGSPKETDRGARDQDRLECGSKTQFAPPVRPAGPPRPRQLHDALPPKSAPRQTGPGAATDARRVRVKSAARRYRRPSPRKVPGCIMIALPIRVRIMQWHLTSRREPHEVFQRHPR